jgi:hypothetical protein
MLLIRNVKIQLQLFHFGVPPFIIPAKKRPEFWKNLKCPLRVIAQRGTAQHQVAEMQDRFLLHDLLQDF